MPKVYRKTIRVEKNKMETFVEPATKDHPAAHGVRKVGSEFHDVVVEATIDVDAILELMGAKAFHNDKKKSRHGHVVVKVIKSKPRSTRIL